MKKPITVIGIDQGYANLGIAVISYFPETQIYEIKEVKTITTSSKELIESRLKSIYNEIRKMINKYDNVKYLGCERLFFNKIQIGGRNKSASMMYTNMASGIIYLICSQKRINIFQYAPTSVKKVLTGNGKASKEDIEEVLHNILQQQNITIKTDHESDAIGIAITLIHKELIL